MNVFLPTRTPHDTSIMLKQHFCNSFLVSQLGSNRHNITCEGRDFNSNEERTINLFGSFLPMSSWDHKRHGKNDTPLGDSQDILVETDPDECCGEIDDDLSTLSPLEKPSYPCCANGYDTKKVYINNELLLSPTGKTTQMDPPGDTCYCGFDSTVIHEVDDGKVSSVCSCSETGSLTHPIQKEKVSWSTPVSSPSSSNTPTTISMSHSSFLLGSTVSCWSTSSVSEDYGDEDEDDSNMSFIGSLMGDIEIVPGSQEVDGITENTRQRYPNSRHPLSLLVGPEEEQLLLRKIPLGTSAPPPLGPSPGCDFCHYKDELIQNQERELELYKWALKELLVAYHRDTRAPPSSRHQCAKLDCLLPPQVTTNSRNAHGTDHSTLIFIRAPTAKRVRQQDSICCYPSPEVSHRPVTSPCVGDNHPPVTRRVRHYPTTVAGQNVMYSGPMIQRLDDGIKNSNGSETITLVPHGPGGVVRFVNGDLYLGNLSRGRMEGYGSFYPSQTAVPTGRGAVSPKPSFTTVPPSSAETSETLTGGAVQRGWFHNNEFSSSVDKTV